MNTTTTNYQQQALDFLQSTGTIFNAQFNRNAKYFEDDKEFRDIYTITLMRGEQIYTFDFGQSLNHSTHFVIKGKKKSGTDYINMKFSSLRFATSGEANTFLNKQPYEIMKDAQVETVKGQEPTPYDVLSCLQKYELGTFDDFCSEFGYNDRPLTDYPKVMNIYNAVRNEYSQLSAMFSEEEMEQLREIN